MPRPARIATVLAPLLALGLAACGAEDPQAAAQAEISDEPGELVVYSGRNENLIGPLLEQFEEATGQEVQVRYGNTAEMAAQLLEEGDATPADLFISQDAGALGALAEAGRLATLPQDTLDAVDQRFRSDAGEWVGLSGRARVLAYDPDQVDPAEVPTTVAELTDPKWKGKVAIAPGNASFQAFVTAMRVLEGDEATRQWLEDLQANDVQIYDNNVLILDAVEAGEVPLGLINHYYWYERVAEQGEDAVNARLQFLEQDDPGALVNVAGAGILAGANAPEEAQELLDYLLGADAQTYFAEETAEYPLAAGVELGESVPPLSEVSGPDIDLSDLSTLQETLTMLQEVGLL